MGRFIVTIRQPGQPTCYYLSRTGFRCYTPANVAVLHTLAEATEQRDHFAALMPGFVLTVERLPPRVSVSAAILRAVPVEATDRAAELAE